MQIEVALEGIYLNENECVRQVARLRPHQIRLLGANEGFESVSYLQRTIQVIGIWLLA
jgi:hypothetical protein